MAITAPVRPTSGLTIEDLDAVSAFAGNRVSVAALLEDSHILLERDFRNLDERIDWTNAVAFTSSRVRSFLHVDLRASRFFGPGAGAWTGYGANGIRYAAGVPVGGAPNASWQTEVSAAGVKGSRATFPQEVYIVGTDDELSIMDVTRGGELWMRFPIYETDVSGFYRGLLFRSEDAQGIVRLAYSDGLLAALSGDGVITLISFANDEAAVYKQDFPFRTGYWPSTLEDRAEILAYQKVLHPVAMAGAPTTLTLGVNPASSAAAILMGTTGGLSIARIPDLSQGGATASSDLVSSSTTTEVTATAINSSNQAVWGAGGVLRRTAAITGLGAPFAAAASATVGSRVREIVQDGATTYFLATDSGVHYVDFTGPAVAHRYSAPGGGAQYPILVGGHRVDHLRLYSYGAQQYLVCAMAAPNQRAIVIDATNHTRLRDLTPATHARRTTLRALARQIARVED